MRIHVAAIVLTASTAVAQIPDGHYAVTSYAAPLSLPTGGVTVVDPRAGMRWTLLQGMPQELTGSGTQAWAGANQIEIRATDGALVIGERGETGFGIDLHVLTLHGLTVSSHTKILVGVVNGPGDGGIVQIALLSDDEALVAVDGLAPIPPLNGAPLARISLSTRAVIPINPAPQPRRVEAVALDVATSTVYFSETLVGPLRSSILSMPVAGGATRTVAQNVDHVKALAVHDNGLLYAASDGVAPSIASIDPVTGQTSVFGVLAGGRPTAVAIERATGNIVFVTGWGLLSQAVHSMNPSGGGQTTVMCLTLGHGSGIAVNDNPRAYGNGSPATHNYTWNTTPNPGGLPRIGNGSFGLKLESTGPNASGALLVSATRGSTPVAGIELLLGLASLLHVGGMPSSGDVPLPIPLDPNLVGGSLFFQTLHLDPGGLAGSDGLRMTIMP